MSSNKKVLTYVLLCIISVLTISLNAKAEDNKCGPNVTFKVENGTLTISGTGSMYDYITGTPGYWTTHGNGWVNNPPYIDQKESITKIVIEEGVTHIGNQAFEEFDKVESVSMSNTVESIGDWTFSYCSSLKNIILSDNLKKIGDNAFQGSGLINIILPNSLTDIGKAIFFYCESLSSITLSDKISEIDDSAFMNCKSLESITIPDSVTSIGKSTFVDCKKLSTVKLSKNIENIGEGAFWNCGSLKSIILPNSLKTIGEQGFWGCNGLTNVSLPKGVTKIEDYLFCGCHNLKSITIPDSVTNIEQAVFLECYKLSDIYYEGSEQQWDNITIDESSGREIENVTIHYNSNNIENNSNNSENSGNDNVEKIINEVAKNGNSSTYNPKLSYLMMQVANAAYNDHGSDARSLYNKLGFSDSQYKEYDFKEKTINKKGYMIGTKEVDGTPVILIAIRGTYGNDFNVEWQTNIMGALPGLDKRAEHTAFSTWAGEIFDTIHENYWSQKAKYFITGHSRGAGAANLLTKRLIDNGLSKQNIFNYNFACPDVAVDYPWNWMSSNKYSNIFNIGYATDPVTYLPGSIGNVAGATGTVMSAFFDPRAMVDGTGISWGKYGNSVWFSNNWNDPNDAYPPVSDKISEGHLQNNYLSFLEKLPSYNAAKSYLEVVTNRTRVAISSLIAQIFGFYCPVDVMIKNSKGTLVASVIDGKVNYYKSTFGLVIIAVSGDHKVIYINSNEDYTVELTGTDNGTMTFCKGNIDNQTNTVTEEIAFANVKLNKGKKMIANAGGDIKPQEMELYVLNNLGEKTKEIDTKGNETDLQTLENHVLTKVDKKEATCLTDGNIEYWTCETCGKMFSDEAGTQEVTTVAIEKTGHKLQKVDAKAATSSSAGNVEYYECSVCHKKFSDQAATKELQDREMVIPHTGGNSERSEEKTNDPSSCSEEDQNVSSRSNSGTETTVSSNSGTTDNSEAIGTVGSTYNPGIVDNQENTSESDSTEKQEAVTTVNDLITIPLTPTGVKVKAIKKGKVIVSWKKIKKSKKTKDLLAQIKTIQIQYSTDPTFNQNPVAKTIGKNKMEIVLKLKKKTTYYIRLRYVGKDGFSNWSKVKKVKMK